MDRFFFVDDIHPPTDIRQSVAYWSIRARQGDKHAYYVTPEVDEESIMNTLMSVAQMDSQEATGMIEDLLFYGYLSLSQHE